MVDVVVMNHDDDTLLGLSLALQDCGYTTAARHAQGALEDLASFIRIHEPRVVVYDLGRPPWEDGIEKWRALCRQPGAHGPYVITTTNAALQLEPSPCFASTVLLKPVGFDEVAEAVKKAMPP
jgi:CheY-like chemotaxis protein